MTAAKGRRPGQAHRFTASTPEGFTDPRVGEFAEWLRAGGRRPRTIEVRTRHVERFARNSGVSCVSACHADIVDWFASHAWAPATAALVYESLNTWFTWLKLMGYREDNPMSKVLKTERGRGEPRPISDKDLVRMLTVRMHHTTRVMILLASLAGLRCSEVAMVRGENIDAGRGLIWVLGKSARGKAKSVPLHPLLAAAADTMPTRGFWFPGAFEREGLHVSATAVGGAIRRVMRRAGVPGTPHSLRHYFGSELLHNGADLVTIMKLMRHASVASTQVYVRSPDELQREAIATLDPWKDALKTEFDRMAAARARRSRQPR